MSQDIKAGNWKDWRHFFAFGLDEYEDTHYLWQHGNNVNSPLLAEHNSGEITRRLEKAGVDAEATTVGGGLRGTFIYAHLVRVADEEGQPIPSAVEAVRALKQRLDDYPILNHEGYDQKVEEANHKLLVDELRCSSNSLNWDYPYEEGEGAYHQLAWDILSITQESENHYEEWFPTFSPGGDVAQALEELGYCRVDEEEVA